MERAVFAARLAEASRRAVELARRFVVESLPDEVRFTVHLNVSYDGHPLHADETLYPEDNGTQLARVDLDQVISVLWRDGTVPEWLDLSVESSDDEVTIIEVLSCGRFTANESLLYHEHEGRPPIHVVGPSLPPDWQEGERFSLWWSVTARDRATLVRAVAHASAVTCLVAQGAWCDDDALALAAQLPRMVALRLEHTAVAGRGLPRLAGCCPLASLFLTGVGPHPLDLSSIDDLATLTFLHIGGEPVDLVGLDDVGRLDALRDLTLRTPVLQNVEPLAALRALECLSLEHTRIADDQVRHLAHLLHLRVLALGHTPVSDATLDVLATAPVLDRLDVRNTDVTLDGVARLHRARPHLRILADGWKHPPRVT